MKIAIINTGGTISCVGAPLAPMSAQAFAKACKTLIDETIIFQDYPNTELHYAVDVKFPESSTGTLDSTNLQPTDWCIIASYILDHYSEYDGWVVLHGTDSMDFTGTALPFLLSIFNDRGVTTAQLSKPVIITGSQLPMFYQGPSEKEPSALAYNTDAFQNFCGAIAAAQSGIPEVCVYFHNQLYRGNRVLKTNASEFDAFSSPNYPSLGECGIQFKIQFENILPPPVSKSVSLDDATARNSAIQQLNYISPNINSFPAMQFNAFPAWYAFNDSTKTCSSLIANLLNACVASGVKGLILESYGEGNFPSGNPDNPPGGAVYQALAAANAAGVVIVDCTRVIAGVVNDIAYAAGAWLPAVGALNPADMTPMAAFVKLMILLTSAGYRKWTASQLKTLMQTNLLGEMMSVNKLDSRVNPLLLANQTLTALDGSTTLTNDPVVGPVLRESTGVQLWAAISPAPAADQLPGRLIMQNDGNLVFYSRYNAPMWATNTGVSTGASSMLVLSGSAGKPADLALLVYDYDHNAVTKTLYQQKLACPSQRVRRKQMTSSRFVRRFKLSGRIAPDDQFHQIRLPGRALEAPDEHLIPPTIVNVNITVPPGTGTIGVPQYAPTVVGGPAAGYDPPGDCDGNYMSYKFQANSNCYAYGCNISTNTFPQPGRQSGFLLTAANFRTSVTALGQTVSSYAVKDGFIFVGTAMTDLTGFKSSRQDAALNGHFVALMVSPAGDQNWPGDYHWARCDNSSGPCDSWSQKDGGDQVTNFDFAGHPITNPATANWTVNQGPLSQAPNDNQDLVVDYQFYCFMFVPASGVNII